MRVIKIITSFIVASAILLVLSSCSKSGGQYRIHGSVGHVSVKEYNASGGVVGSPTVPLTNGVSEVITAAKGAISVEVPEQEQYSTYDNKKKTYTSVGPIALVPDGVTEVWLKTK